MKKRRFFICVLYGLGGQLVYLGGEPLHMANMPLHLIVNDPGERGQYIRRAPH